MQRRILKRGALACLGAAALAAGGASAAQAAQIDNDTVIVKYRSGISENSRSGLLERLGVDRTLGSVNGLGAKVLRVSGDPRAVAAQLNQSDDVLYAEPNVILKATATPNDPRFGELYGLNNTGQGGGKADADIDAPEGWDAGGLGSFPNAGGAKIGIVDTGIDKTHEDLQGKTVDCAQSLGFLIFPGSIKEGSCTDDNDHGTHVAGTAAGIANNGKGVAGVAFNSPLTICKALTSGGSGTTADIANCINWETSKGVKVISMSLGGGASTTLQQAVQNASKSAVVVAAAGNDGNATLNYPAAYAEAVSVGATDNKDAKASFSNANSDVEVSAPGVNVLSAKRGGGYVAFSGTSMATPHAAGVAAVIATLNPGYTPAQIRSKLDSSVDDLGTAGRDTSYGFGRVNLAKAATR